MTPPPTSCVLGSPHHTYISFHFIIKTSCRFLLVLLLSEKWSTHIHVICAWSLSTLPALSDSLDAHVSHFVEISQ